MERETLPALTAALRREHDRLRRRSLACQLGALLCVPAALLAGGPALALFSLLGGALTLCSWLGSARWRSLVSALQPHVRQVSAPGEAYYLLEIGRFFELAPFAFGTEPDGSRHWPLTLQKRTLATALARLLPRLDASEAASLTPAQRAWLQRCLESCARRPDAAYSTDFLVAALLVLGPSGQGECRALARRLRAHPEARVRAAAKECLHEGASPCA